MKPFYYLWLFITLISCKDDKSQFSPKYDWLPLKVTATAYNSIPGQTSHKHPKITAWGDSIEPGVKWIAVSRDLIKEGLTYNTMVKIDTFQDIYLVKDKMNHRWQNRIDIYMGEDVKKAKEWGRKKITIWYAVERDTTKKE